MKVQFELTIGENKFTLIEDVENHSDFFKKLHFYSTLPKTGPNGETDLVLTYRVAQKQYEYFSIVSQKAQMEFKFGQLKESKGGLFAKGWEPLYTGDGSEETDEPVQTATTGIKAPTIVQQPPVTVTSPPVTLTPGSTKTQTPPSNGGGNPAVKSSAASILAQFGIKQ